MSAEYVALHTVNSGFIERRVKIVRHSFHLAEAIHEVHLVLHQRDEW